MAGLPDIFNLFRNKNISINELFKKADNNIYSVSSKDWYKSFPYRFVVVIETKKTDEITQEEKVEKTEKCYYSLPIPPESLSYQMIPASQLTPTLGGVVEETSANVFWQIALSGTTGISIGRQYYNVNDSFALYKDGLNKPAIKEENFRAVLKGGIFANNFNNIKNLYDAGVDVFDSDTRTDAAFGLLEELATTSQRFKRSGVIVDTIDTDLPGAFLRKASRMLGIDPRTVGAVDATNGYVEIHLFHNFLNVYSKIKEENPDTTKLYFESQKDNMQWQVAIKNFAFQKNANQPYLYKYNIVLQGFNLLPAGTDEQRKKLVTSRFGDEGDLASINSITITGAITKANQLASKIRKIGKTGGESLISKPPVI